MSRTTRKTTFLFGSRIDGMFQYIRVFLPHDNSPNPNSRNVHRRMKRYYAKQRRRRDLKDVCRCG